MTTVTVPWSKLLQQPNQVTAELATNDAVRLARRGAEDLILTTAGRDRAQSDDADLLTRTFAALVKRDEAARGLLLTLPEIFPWVRFLPEDAVREFLVEFVETARACAEIQRFTALHQVIVEWKHTAEIHSDPELHAQLSQSFEPDPDLPPVTPAEETA
ncbi:prevent-host-death family protein [Streptomyces sp. B6B3]|uniref:prevent-host-death family protein n=1 Tax=Streptomyces sp. B6B3 TaxID=3153570 RepID=UPI00325C5D7F